MSKINKLHKLLLNIKHYQFINKKFLFQENIYLFKSILNLLWDESYISFYTIINNKIKIVLKYLNAKSSIKAIKVLSKSTKPLYFSAKQLWLINSTYFFILSTSHGLKSLIDCKVCNLGGEVLVIIY